MQEALSKVVCSQCQNAVCQIMMQLKFRYRSMSWHTNLNAGVLGCRNYRIATRTAIRSTLVWPMLRGVVVERQEALPSERCEHEAPKCITIEDAVGRVINRVVAGTRLLRVTECLLHEADCNIMRVARMPL